MRPSSKLGPAMDQPDRFRRGHELADYRLQSFCFWSKDELKKEIKQAEICKKRTEVEMNTF